MEYIKHRSVVRLVARRCYLLVALICASLFDVVAGADNSAKLTLLGIKPAPQAKAA